MEVGGLTLARVGRLARGIHGDADEAAEQSKSMRSSQSQMSDAHDLVLVSLIGFGTTSSVLLGAAIGLYVPLSKRMLAGLLACAAGALISALAIDLALGSARELRLRGFDFRGAWFFVGGRFALGASLYFGASRFLERSGAAVRYPSRFRKYVQDRERQELRELIRLLAKSDLLRNCLPEEVERFCVASVDAVSSRTKFSSGPAIPAMRCTWSFAESSRF